MDIVLKLPDSLGVNCNRESMFNETTLEALRDVVQLLLAPPPDRSPREKLFFQEWLKALAETSAFAKEAVLEWGTASTYRAIKFETAFASLGLRMNDASERATCYKVLFLAAIHSGRSTDQLIWPFNSLRKELRMDPMVATTITDRLAAKLPLYGYHPEKLSDEEKQAAAALACVVLSADGTTHAQESLAFRMLLNVLGIVELRAEQLIALMARGADGLLKMLPGTKARVALMAVLRVASADRAFHPSEVQLIQKILTSENMSHETLNIYMRHISLELGRSMSL